ncbi:phosphate transporter [Babesia ovata]|uniref:Phosphate transporter n=1 Tax=Babesia ovata TaxID=189622 RepID=A0A2H6KCE3_9APIC|nr:phosphate transporter [Babesia ovata]GBE60661.1 phosphate transporter [Babesia ovata]
MDVSHPEMLWIVITSGIVSGFLALSIGANDVANAFSTSIGSGSLKLRGAISIAVVFEILGALLLGGSVTDAIRKRVLNFNAFKDAPEDLAMGMMCSTASATIWLLFATFSGMPVSTTHSIIGALAGFGVASGRVNSVRWLQMFYIMLSWIGVPLIAVVVSCTMYLLLQEAILKRQQSYKVLYYTLWFLLAITSIPLVIFLAFDTPLMKVKVEEGLLHDYQQWFNASHGNKAAVVVIIMACLLAIAVPFVYICGSMRNKAGWSFLESQNDTNKEFGVKRNSSSRHIPSEDRSHSMELKVGRSKLEIVEISNMGTSRSAYESLLQSAVEDEEDAQRIAQNTKQTDSHKTEVMFSAMQIIGAVTVIISHSANDTANAVAPFATVLMLYMHGIEKSNDFTPWYILLAGGLCMAVGLALFGYRVIKTVGLKLTRVTPSRGYTIDTTAGSIVLVLSQLGVPLSSTHSAVSSILGVGLVENLKTQDSNEEVPVIELKPPSNKFWAKFPIFKRISTKGVNLMLYRKIFVTWITTIFCSGIMSAIIYIVVIFCHKAISGRDGVPTV